MSFVLPFCRDVFTSFVPLLFPFRYLVRAFFLYVYMSIVRPCFLSFVIPLVPYIDILIFVSFVRSLVRSFFLDGFRCVVSYFCISLFI